MAQQTTRRVDSEAVQGKGTFVLVRKLTLGEAEQLRNQDAEAKKSGQVIDDFALGLDLIRSHVLDWNWSDAEERPFPLPSADPSVLARLTDDESWFLAEAIRGKRTEADFRRA